MVASAEIEKQKDELSKLTQKRKRMIDAHRENNCEEGIKQLLSKLYPDTAHFIYELLQNAEDAHAEVVRFTLSDNDIKVEHNGSRLFDIKDVEAITNIGTSTKVDDTTAIGKFGVGFKAVFAYTNTPEVHSGDFHFKIIDLLVPEPLENLSFEPTTRFVFPFNNPNKKPLKAISEIEKWFISLDDSSLLFLSNIKQIECSLSNGRRRSITRKEKDDGIIKICIQDPHKNRISNWLRYADKAVVENEKGEAVELPVSIAYKLERDGLNENEQKDWKIIPSKGQVCIYFPAEKEISNLRFHINAPFASTVARDSVRECDENNQLRDAIAKLIVESLEDIKKRGLLTTDFLEVLPNKQDGLKEFYEPIRKTIVNAFQNNSFVPTKSGEYASARSLYRGPANISNVISDDDLSLLENKSYLWAKNTMLNSLAEKFLESLEIKEWGQKELYYAFHPTEKNNKAILDYKKLHPKDEKKIRELEKQNHSINEKKIRELETWLHSKDDLWLIRLYALLNDLPNKLKKLPSIGKVESLSIDESIDYDKVGIVDFSLKIVKCYGEQFTTSDEVFFFPEGREWSNERDAHAEYSPLLGDGEESGPSNIDVKFVKTEVYISEKVSKVNENAKSFLEHMGVKPYDEKAFIELRLKRYSGKLSVSLETHCFDIKNFLEYWRTNPNTDIFKDRVVVYGFSPDGKGHWCRPSEIYLDVPYENTGLGELRSIHQKYALWDGYKDKLSEKQLGAFIKFISEFGAFRCLKITTAFVSGNPNYHSKLSSYGEKVTSGSFETDWTIESLDRYAESKSEVSSRLIWDAILKANSDVAKAQYRPNASTPVRTADSQLVCTLKSKEWILCEDNVFRVPRKVTSALLRKDFRYDDHNGLLSAIEFGHNAKIEEEKNSAIQKQLQDAAKTLGISIEDSNFVKELKELGTDLRGLLERERSKKLKNTDFPEHSVKNPERRDASIIQDYNESDKKSYDRRQRNVRTSAPNINPKTMLYGEYTNNYDEMVCQICQDKMPFKGRNGKFYFVAVEAFDITNEIERNYIALCPLCAEKYKEFIKRDSKAWENFTDDFIESKDYEIPILLGDKKASIRFTEAHMHDLKIILTEVSKK